MTERTICKWVILFVTLLYPLAVEAKGISLDNITMPIYSIPDKPPHSKEWLRGFCQAVYLVEKIHSSIPQSSTYKTTIMIEGETIECPGID